MNASTILTEAMSLDQKLAAIDAALANATAVAQTTIGAAPVDPSVLLACDGCQ